MQATRFVVISDTHFQPPGSATADSAFWNRMLATCGEAIAESLIETVRALEPEFVVHCGDFTASSQIAQWEYGCSVMERFGCPWYAVPGNHDTWQPGVRERFSARFLRDEKIWDSLVMTSSPGGRHHVAITTVPRFLELSLGTRRLPDSDLDWLLIPEQRLLEVTAGQLFHDSVGEIAGAREELSYFPDNVWKYRLSYVLESLGWELGLIPLCGKRGDMLSMHLNTAMTVGRVMRLAFLINRTYCPGYAKWLHREFSKLEVVSDGIARALETAFAGTDAAAVYSSISQVLDELYVHVRAQIGLPELPVQFPRVEERGSTIIDTQRIARMILGSISGPLHNLSVNGAPLGMADQWVTNEDVLTSPEYMNSLATVYETRAVSLRMRGDEMV